MARQEPIFSGKITIWTDCGEFVAEYDNWKLRYSSKAPSVISAVKSLFEELAEEGVLFGGGSDHQKAEGTK